jgi:pimeloyl-ACP methyl ester carboxylesterase
MSEEVTFRAADGVRLSGRLFGGGDRGVVLSHMLNSSQSAWFDLAGLLALRGYRVLTYDYRGVCPGGTAGCSGGPPGVGLGQADLTGAVRLLRAVGARTVVAVGASIGGEASLVAAARQRVEIDGVASLSTPEIFGDDRMDRALVRRIRVPKLFVVGRYDEGPAEAARAFFRAAGPPKRLALVPTGDHGTDLLTLAPDPIRRKVERALLGFLGSIR